MNPIFFGGVEGGRVKLDRPDQYLIHLSGLEGKRVEVVVRKETHPRSLPMNNYYWGVIIPLVADHLGYGKDEMHEALKVKFASTADEMGLLRVESTAKMTVERFIEYTDEIKRWSAEFLNVYVPDPGEYI